jgi:hypothetical protein
MASIGLSTFVRSLSKQAQVLTICLICLQKVHLVHTLLRLADVLYQAFTQCIRFFIAAALRMVSQTHPWQHRGLVVRACSVTSHNYVVLLHNLAPPTQQQPLAHFCFCRHVLLREVFSSAVSQGYVLHRASLKQSSAHLDKGQPTGLLHS